MWEVGRCLGGRELPQQSGKLDSSLIRSAAARVAAARPQGDLGVVLEPGDDPVPRRSALNLDAVESVSLAVLLDRLGRLCDARMRQMCGALAVAVDCSG